MCLNPRIVVDLSRQRQPAVLARAAGRPVHYRIVHFGRPANVEQPIAATGAHATGRVICGEPAGVAALCISVAHEIVAGFRPLAGRHALDARHPVAPRVREWAVALHALEAAAVALLPVCPDVLAGLLCGAAALCACADWCAVGVHAVQLKLVLSTDHGPGVAVCVGEASGLAGALAVRDAALPQCRLGINSSDLRKEINAQPSQRDP